MSAVICWPNGEGGISVTVPAEGADITAVESAVLPDAVPRVVVDTSSLPDRAFRSAWRFHLEAGAVIDMSAARECHRDRIRTARAPLLADQDIVFMRLLESGTVAQKKAVADKKKALRDAPAASEIEAATDLDALKATWPTDLLGPSPYQAKEG